MAECYTWLGSLELMPSREVLAKAEEFSRKAIELDDSLPNGHLSLGLVLGSKLNFPGALAALKRATELGLKTSDDHLGAAKVFQITNQSEDAIAEVRKAVELDPLSAETSQIAGSIILYSHRADLYDESIGLLRNAIELDPNLQLAHDNLGLALVQKGNYEEGVAEIRKSIEILGEASPIALGELAYAYARAGRPEESKRILSELLAKWDVNQGSAVGIAMAYSSLGDPQKAVEWLTKASEENIGYLPFAATDLVFDGIRADSKFKEFLKKIGVTN
jgi:tetratricopeptide (TPR) repeat protein